MIESYYWRIELRNDLVWINKHRFYKRWSEKQQVLFERKLMLIAFQVRSLLERPKVNDKARKASVSVIRFKKIGDRPFTVIGAGWPDERFAMDHPEPSVLSALDVCNQLIHHYWMQTFSKHKSFDSMLVFSDYMRHKWAYQIRIEDLVQLFSIFCEESSAVTGAKFEWNEKKQDYSCVSAIGSVNG